MNHTSPTDRLHWHKTTATRLHIYREQLESLIWSLLPYVKTSPPKTRATLNRRLEALVKELDELNRVLAIIAAYDLTTNEAQTIYTPHLSGLIVPALLVGVSAERAKRLAANARHLYMYPGGRLDQTDLATLHSFFFSEVKDSISQIGLDIKTKWPCKFSDLIKAPCQRTESAAIAMAVCFQ